MYIVRADRLTATQRDVLQSVGPRGAVEPARDAGRAGGAGAATRRCSARSATTGGGAAAGARGRGGRAPDLELLQRAGRLRGGWTRVRDGPRRGTVDAVAVDQRDRKSEPSASRSPSRARGTRGRSIAARTSSPPGPTTRSAIRRARPSTSGTRRPGICGGRRRSRSARRPRPTSSATGRATRGFEHVSHGISLELLQFVPLDDSIKISRLTLTNESGRAAAAVRDRLRRMGPWRVAARRRAVRRHRDRREDGRDVRAQRVETRVRRSRGVCRSRRDPNGVDRRSDGISRS